MRRLPGKLFQQHPGRVANDRHHDDQADDGFLAIRGPEVSLGSLRSTGRARSPRQVRGRFPRQIHISKVEGHATRLRRGALTAMAWHQSSSTGLARHRRPM